MTFNTWSSGFNIPLKDLSAEELSTRLKVATESKNTEDIIAIAEEMKKRNRGPVETDLWKSFEEKRKAIQEKLAKWETVDPQELKDFLEKDIPWYQAGAQGAFNTTRTREKELQENLKKILFDTQGFKEIFSFSKRHLVTISNSFDELEGDTHNYPKNVFIYAMSVIQGSHFGVRQQFKRGRVKLTRRWKKGDIKKNLEELEDMLEIDIKKDSPTRQMMKEEIKKRVVKAKGVYLENIKKKIF